MGDVRISIRDKIFREVISNLLIHRNYASAYPAKLIIGKDSIHSENANKPNGYGIIDPNDFSPYHKNPNIAKFFKELGLVDELGSGVRNIHKYGKTYFGYEPQITEDDIFKIVFKTSERDITHQATHHVDKIKAMIGFCEVTKTRWSFKNF